MIQIAVVSVVDSYHNISGVGLQNWFLVFPLLFSFVNKLFSLFANQIRLLEREGRIFHIRL